MRDSDSYDPIDDSLEPEQPPPNRGFLLFFGLSLGVFTFGGLFFGYVFLLNLRTLAAQGDLVTVSIPVAGPVTISTRPQLPQLELPSLPSSLPQIGQALQLPEWQGDKPIGILLLGIDKRPDEPADQARTDTMLLVVINPQTKAAAMVSLPRDLWVQIPGYGEQRINVAHAIGGPDLAKRAVQQNFGVQVDYYARIDFDGFEQIVDTLGGVLVDVERPIKDDHYPTENYGMTRIYIAPGPQLMNGETALQYVRSRHSENDFGRMRRQQRFLVALRDRALQLNVLPKLPTLIPLAQKTVATDLGPAQMLALARLGSEIQRERIHTLVLDTRYAEPYLSPEGADLLLPRTQAIRSAIHDLLSTTQAPSPTEGGRAGVRAEP